MWNSLIYFPFVIFHSFTPSQANHDFFSQDSPYRIFSQILILMKQFIQKEKKTAETKWHQEMGRAQAQIKIGCQNQNINFQFNTDLSLKQCFENKQKAHKTINQPYLLKYVRQNEFLFDLDALSDQIQLFLKSQELRQLQEQQALALIFYFFNYFYNWMVNVNLTLHLTYEKGQAVLNLKIIIFCWLGKFLILRKRGNIFNIDTHRIKQQRNFSIQNLSKVINEPKIYHLFISHPQFFPNQYRSNQFIPHYFLIYFMIIIIFHFISIFFFLMNNFRTANYAASYLDQPRMAFSSLSKNYGYSVRNPAFDDDHNHGQIEFMLENERKKFKQAKQKFQYDLDNERKLRIQFENKLIKLKDEFSRKEVILSELQFKINNLLHQNQDLAIENQRVRTQIVRLEDAYGSKIHELEGRLAMETKNYDDMTNQYNSQFEKFKKQGQQYIQQISFDYQRKIKNLQEKTKLSQSVKRELGLQNKKLNDILITNKLAFEEEIRDLKNRAREEEIKKTQYITKSFDQKLKMVDDSKQSIIRKNNELLRLLQEKDRQIQEVQNQKSQQLSRLRQQCSDFSQQLTHLNYIITKLKTEIAQKDNLLGRSYADNDGELVTLKQQLEIKKQEVFQLSSTAKDLRIALKNSQNEWEGRRRDLVERANHFQKEGKKYKDEYERICQVLKSRINDTISAVSHKR